MWTAYFLSALVGYLLGSIPTGYLVGRLKGVDIRQHGSRNIGATNVVRVLGKGPGFTVFGVDALKGLVAVWAGFALLQWARMPEIYALASHPRAFNNPEVNGARDQAMFNLVVPGGIVAAIACILGHNFPVWLRFKGGKGIATSAGVLLGLMPLAVAISAAVWAAAFFTLRYVSVASLLAAAVLPVTVGILWRTGRADAALFAFSLLAAALAIWRHRGNIQRLLAGTEPRFSKKSEVGSRKSDV